MSQAEFDTETIKIGDDTYGINLLDTSTAFNISQELMKLSLPSLGAAADGMFSQDSWEDPSTFTAIAFHFIRQSSEVNTLVIIKEMLEGSTVDGAFIDFDRHFRGKPDLLAKVVGFALKENFGGLFTMLGLKERLATFTKDLNPEMLEQLISDVLGKLSTNDQNSQTETDSSS